jgi:hypothetical protein
MTAEIVNLRRFRKAKVRSDAETKAAENRVLHGRTKAEKTRDAFEKERATRALDQTKREP